MQPETWTLVLGISGLVIIPYNVWLISQVFKIKASIKALEARDVERDKTCEVHMTFIRDIGKKVDKVAEGVARIEGQLERK